MSKFVVNLARNTFEAAKPKARLALRYAALELTPPNPTEIPQIIRGVGNIVRGLKNGHWRTLPVREAWLNAAITVEVICWFYVGECIGKRSLVGYQV